MDNRREVDIGRPHTRRGGPSPVTVALLERYRDAMRAELGELLEDLRPVGAQLTIAGAAELMRPPLAERVKLWDLAIRLGRELGAAIEELPPEPGPTGGADGPARTRRAPRLSARERRQLGG